MLAAAGALSLAACSPAQTPPSPAPSSTVTWLGRPVITLPRPSSATSSTATHGPAVPMPDPKLTPGVVMTTDLQIVCHTSTAGRRNVTTATRNQVFAAYKITGSRTNYELDHLIPLELGGSNDAGNLWPEPAPSFHVKDILENRLHALVCAGRLDLATAQHAIATDWQAAALAYP